MMNPHSRLRSKTLAKSSNPFTRQFKYGSQVYEFIPKKQLGQNFLIDGNIIEKMLAACQFKDEDTILEIGPGLGVLTQRIAPLVKKLYAVETDLRLFKSLQESNSQAGLEIIHADFLKLDLSPFPLKMKGLGNLPYYITTPIIDKILKNRKHFHTFFITVQLELGQRLVAAPGTKSSSAFTLFVQYFADVKMLFKIKNTSFKPAPKVHSCFLEFKIHDPLPLIAENEPLLFSIIKNAFQQRRKMLPKALSGLIDRDAILEELKSLSIGEKSRAEELTLKEFVLLTNQIHQKKINLK